MLGKCPTEIIESHLEDEIEILKHRETEKCEGRPKHTIISQSQVGVLFSMSCMLNFSILFHNRTGL